MSPDSRFVYATAAAADTISRFLRDGPQGQIGYGGCLTVPAGSPGCVEVGGQSLVGSRGVAVSPDGGALYSTSAEVDAVLHFALSTFNEGDLTLADCLATSPTDGTGCGDLPPAGQEGPVDNPFALAMSPDGGSVYVVSVNGGAIARFTVGPGGALGYVGCLANAPGRSAQPREASSPRQPS